MGIKKVLMCKDDETYEALTPDAEALYFTPEPDPDEVPTEGSSNTVTSGGVYEANKQLQENINSVEEDLETLSADVKNHKDIYENKIQDLYTRTNGLGGYLTGYDFGTSYPTQQELTNYAMEQIPNAIVETDIFNQTKVVNLYDNHIWILTNTQDSDPVVFEWVDKGTEAVGDANNDGLHGLITGSNKEYRGHIEADGTISVNGLESKLDELDQKDADATAALDKFKTDTNTTLDRLDDEILTVDTKLEKSIDTLEALGTKTDNFIQAVSGEVKTRILKNVTANFVADTTYTDFKGRAFIPVENFGNFSSVLVVLSTSQSYDNYLRAHGDTSKALMLHDAPVTTNGGFYLYRTTTGSTVIPTIVVFSVPAVGVNFNRFPVAATYTIKDSSGNNISSGTLNRLVYLPEGTYTITVAETDTTYPMVRTFTVGDVAYTSPFEQEQCPFNRVKGSNIAPDDYVSPYPGYSDYYNITYNASSDPVHKSFNAEFRYPGHHRSLQTIYPLEDGDVVEWSYRMNKNMGDAYGASGEVLQYQDPYFKVHLKNTVGSDVYNDYGIRASGRLMDGTISVNMTVLNGSPFTSILQPVFDLKNTTDTSLQGIVYDLRIIRRDARYYFQYKYSTDEHYVTSFYVDMNNLNQHIETVVSGNAGGGTTGEPVTVFDYDILNAYLYNKGTAYADQLINEGKTCGYYNSTYYNPIAKNIFGKYTSTITGNLGVVSSYCGNINSDILEAEATFKIYANTTETFNTYFPFFGVRFNDAATGKTCYLGLQDSTTRYVASLNDRQGYHTRMYILDKPQTTANGEFVWDQNLPGTSVRFDKATINSPVTLKLKVVRDGNMCYLYCDNGTGTISTTPQLTVDIRKLFENNTSADGATWTELEGYYPGDKVQLGFHHYGDTVYNPVVEILEAKFKITSKN